MPQKEVNYDTTHFYKIVCKDTSITNCYVGHTTNFKSRKHHHKSNCYNTNAKHYNLYVYEFIRENGGWENWDMIEITTEKCLDGLEAKRKERDHIEKLNATLNIIKRPHVEQEEKRELYKEYYDTHREKISEQKKGYYKDTVEERRAYRKQRYYENQETEQQKRKDYYYKNKKMIECGCGSVYSSFDKKKHEQSQKHQQYIQVLEQNNPQE